MATPRRRSARLSKNAQPQRQSARKQGAATLGSLIERDETPEVNEPQSLDEVVATPTSAVTTKSQLAMLSGLKTPKTEPRVDRGEMHPEHAHQTTTKAPDSGLKLGFVDISSRPRTIASAQNTPSKARTSTPAHFQSTSVDFKFGAESQLSTEAQKLMDNVREEAASIKAQMQAERDAQQEKDDKAEAEFNGVNASGRKIAKPKGKAGRFSDIHMAQFKKMDSIANHPSAFRGKPSFAQPTTQSLKRSGSKAGLDENERPRTAGKGTPARRPPPPPFLGRPTSVSPFKSIPSQSERIENTTPAKRARHSELHDVSASRPVEPAQPLRTVSKPMSSNLFSPTKASLARAAASQIPVSSPNKASSLKRPASVKSLRTASSTPGVRPATAHGASYAPNPSKAPSADKARLNRPLPPPPENESSLSPSPESAKVVQAEPDVQGSSALKHHGFSSRLPKFNGLKSILRTGRRTDIMPPTQERQGTPKRPATATTGSGDVKKVDFTPSVKSRYAVKLAAGSPSPAKLPTQLTPGKALGPLVAYDPAAYVLGDDDGDDAWEDAESEIDYPVLPAMSSSPAQPVSGTTFEKKAKEHSRRASKEFKSIFTTLHHPSRPTQPSNLASVNARVNKSGPTAHVDKIMRSPSNTNFSRPSPSTIRRVRTSGAPELVQPFEDAEVQTVPHGIPGKKRRRESTASNEDEDSFEPMGKENRRISVMPSVPGGWCDTPQPEEQDEGQQRGGKRAKVGSSTTSPEKPQTEVKKPRQSMAREMAKKSADARKGKGILSLSRLNMLSRPKQRG
ncbi:hypothetical protein PV08_05458 [Exophiala spinifera]|uniref:Erythromycin esterase n=1 Tax=Exophiala spinifera TaxID=91928 RepID=A0A0D1ZRK5_9EURO|nr:uncharacterized protein PV08_05458 [Exophiala spinifera]KIW15412.1 hypothetical protein PV08_05458 [Exophiala spinifera]